MTQEFSIWLVPDRESAAHDRLQETIRSYAQRYPDAPEFRPHVTVVGGLDRPQAVVTDTARSLAAEYGPLAVSVLSASCSTTTHQCVFLLVEPTRELLELHRSAVERFDTPAEMYVPHLSLVYGDVPVADRIALVETVESASLPSTVTLDTVEVVETSGPVPEWTTVASYRL